MPQSCPKQRFTAVTNGQQRSVATASDLRHRLSLGGRTVLPKLAVPIVVGRAGLQRNATITTMDRDWMRERLEEFRAVCQEYERSSQHGSIGDENVLARMHRMEPTARAVLRALDPELANFNLDTMAGEYDGIKAADRGLGMLADLDDVTTRLRPEAPTLPADQLHPWVWDAARTFWDAGAHAVAVEQAAKSITAHTQQKTGCQLADDDLMSQVWSDEPPSAARPRLRFPGDRSAKTWQSRQRGARSLAQGCYGGIRNVVAHDHAPDRPQQLALEYLACLISSGPLDQRGRGRKIGLTRRVARSVVGPHGIGNRWSSAGTSGHRRLTRIAGHTAFTAPTSHGATAWGRVRIPRPPAGNWPHPTDQLRAWRYTVGGRLLRPALPTRDAIARCAVPFLLGRTSDLGHDDSPGPHGGLGSVVPRSDQRRNAAAPGPCEPDPYRTRNCGKRSRRYGTRSRGSLGSTYASRRRRLPGAP